LIQIILLIQEVYSMKKIKMTSHKIVIDKSEISFDYEIEEYLLYDDTLIVRLNWEKENINSYRNILAFNNFGELLWKIDSKLNGKYPYVKIDKDDNDVLIAYNFSGLKLSLDPLTGLIIKYNANK